MAVIQQDLKWMYTADNPAATGEPRTSFKTYATTTQIVGGVNNLFAGITGDENVALTARYRNFVVTNYSPDNSTLSNVVLRVFSNDFDSTGAAVSICVDPLYGSVGDPEWTSMPVGGVLATAVANDTTAPAGAIWTDLSAAQDTEIELPSLDSGEGVAIWIRRTATNSGGNPDQDVTFTLIGTTEA
jgi:hypothetical protein